jgi:hypothetical protein
LEIPIQRRLSNPLVGRTAAHQRLGCKDVREQKVIRCLSLLKDQHSVGVIFTRGNLSLFEKLANLRTARIAMPVILLREIFPGFSD